MPTASSPMGAVTSPREAISPRLNTDRMLPMARSLAFMLFVILASSDVAYFHFVSISSRLKVLRARK